jgi:hypothetical protein
MGNLYRRNQGAYIVNIEFLQHLLVQYFGLENDVTNPNSNEYKLTEIVLDIARHRFSKPIDIKNDETV